MSTLKIAMILGFTRPGRNGKAVADWVVDRAGTRTGAEYELVDLADRPLPFTDEPVPPSMGQYQGEQSRTASGLRPRMRPPRSRTPLRLRPSTTTPWRSAFPAGSMSPEGPPCSSRSPLSGSTARN
ncbi:NAD(P)H-dependent oxidoreductase [Streptomyces sp. NPDC001928]|uniref:NADPH-dependent FMN reductase n=1 Tax=Streptomyces sp. NPDC001928 TaxID=3154404 RepID=UPI003319583E